MKLQTPVTDEKCRVGISYNDRIMILGSCFSDNIGKQLKDFGFDVSINPFGTLYNPASIVQSIEMLASGKMFSEKDCVDVGAGSQLICSLSHHTSFARKTAEEFLADANESLTQARDFFRVCNKIIITLGTRWCFRHNDSGMIVSNCLKRPACEYTRERLSVSETTKYLNRIIEICTESEDITAKEFIFTVSPIRHFKDGAHGNQISKAGLLLSIEDIISGRHADRCDYFPAYEIMMDQLRDYRFYAEDMCHPSQQAIDYIRERFLAWALKPEENPVLEENIKKYKRNKHIYKPE